MTDESPRSLTGGGGEKKLTIRETIRSLSYWPEIEHRLVTGESLKGTVKLIQTRGDLVGEYPTTVLKVFDKMRLVLRRPETTDLEPGSQRLEGTPKPGELQFELQRLEKLFQMQMGRIKVDRKLEKTLKKLLPSVSKEIDLSLRIAQSILSAKQEAGVLKRVPERWYGELKLPTGVQLPSDPGSRERILRTVRRFIVLVGAKGHGDGRHPDPSRRELSEPRAISEDGDPDDREPAA